MMALTGAQISMIAGAALLAVGVGFLIYQMFQSQTAAEKAAASGKKWAQTQVENANAAHDTGLALADLLPKFEAVTQELTDTQKQYDALKKKQEEQFAATNSSNAAFDETSAKMAELIPHLEKMKAEHEVLAPAVAKLRHEQELAQAAAEAQAASNDRLADTAKGVATATNSQIQSVQGLANAYLAAQGGPLAYEAAQIRVQQSEAETARVAGVRVGVGARPRIRHERS